ncbi:hypothetical protein [Sphingomonas mucosissima]|uniref:Uncharacterized protein n=1 Tax=Sphingomonas mucosissima TaxID=370959 RepID=A0A245ZS08_9SPHN|nr:hypothetical protein [Sphingomonas mucosissima]OWK32514.1 hypothetical protein SPMU_08470 [Sphingomonas mucosissima]
MTGERRRAALTMAGIGVALSALCGWLLVDSISTFLSAWREGAPEVRVSGGDVGMLVLMPIFAGLAIYGFAAIFGDGAIVQRIGVVTIVAALITLPLALGGSWAFQNWAEERLKARGYVRCGAERVGRFPSTTMCKRGALPPRI